MMNGETHEALTARAGSAATDAPDGAHVLTVDARPAAHAALAAALRDDGHHLLAAADADTALALLARERPAAALVHEAVLDTSASLVRQLRAAAPGLPIIVYGRAAARQAEMLHGLDVGIAAVDGDEPAPLREALGCALAAMRCVDRLRHEHELRSLALVQLCHTLRAPLDVIQGYAELLRETPDAPDGSLLLEGLSCAVANAVRLTREHLAVASLDAPGLAVRCDPVELDGLIDDLRRLTTRPLAGRRLRLVASAPARGAVLYTDGDKLRALLAQLVTQAAEGTPRRVLRLYVRAEVDGTRFELRDRAGGAPPGALPSGEALGDPPPRDNPGLALIQRLAATLGAVLGTRRAPGGGTVFTLHVPAALTLPPAEHGLRTVH